MNENVHRSTFKIQLPLLWRQKTACATGSCSRSPIFCLFVSCGLAMMNYRTREMDASLATVEGDGAEIAYRRVGKGRPLLVLNGFAATSADWDPSFIDRLASSNELILLNNRGIGGSTDDGQSFDIEKLAADAAHVIETLGIEHASVMGWSMGGFIAQAFSVKYAARVNKLVLLSTDPGGIEAD